MSHRIEMLVPTNDIRLLQTRDGFPVGLVSGHFGADQCPKAQCRRRLGRGTPRC